MTSILSRFDSNSPQAYKRFRWELVNWETEQLQGNLTQLDWSQINLKKAAAGAGFSIDLVNWNQINQSTKAATSAYKTFDWASVDWSSVEPTTLEALDWGKINLKKAATGKEFSINNVDWDEVNSSSTATSAYKTFNWAAVRFSDLSEDTRNSVDWQKVNWKRLPSSTVTEAEAAIGRDLNGDKQIGALPTPSTPDNAYYTETSEQSTYSDSRGTTDNYQANSKILYHFTNTGLPKLIVETETVQFQGSDFISTCINYYYVLYGTNSASIVKFTADSLNKAPEVNRVSSIAYSSGGESVALESLYLSTSQLTGPALSGNFSRFRKDISLSSALESFNYNQGSTSTDPLLSAIDAALNQAQKSGTPSNQTWNFQQSNLNGSLTVQTANDRIKADATFNANLDAVSGLIKHTYEANIYAKVPTQLINWMINDTVFYQGEFAYNDNTSGLNFYDSTQLLTTGLPTSPNQRTTRIEDSITNQYVTSQGGISYGHDPITGLITSSTHDYSAIYSEGFQSSGRTTNSGTTASSTAIQSGYTFTPGEGGYVTTESLLSSLQPYLPLLNNLSWGGEASLLQQNLLAAV